MNRFHTPQRSDINPSSKHASSFTCQHLPTQAKAGSTMAGLPVARNPREVCHDGNLDFPEFRQRISKNESTFSRFSPMWKPAAPLRRLPLKLLKGTCF